MRAGQCTSGRWHATAYHQCMVAQKMLSSPESGVQLLGQLIQRQREALCMLRHAGQEACHRCRLSPIVAHCPSIRVLADHVVQALLLPPLQAACPTGAVAPQGTLCLSSQLREGRQVGRCTLLLLCCNDCWARHKQQAIAAPPGAGTCACSSGPQPPPGRAHRFPAGLRAAGVGQEGAAVAQLVAWVSDAKPCWGMSCGAGAVAARNAD